MVHDFNKIKLIFSRLIYERVKTRVMFNILLYPDTLKNIYRHVNKSICSTIGEKKEKENKLLNRIHICAGVY